MSFEVDAAVAPAPAEEPKTEVGWLVVTFAAEAVLLFAFWSVLCAFIWTTYWQLSLDPHLVSIDLIAGATLVVAAFCPLILGIPLARQLLTQWQDWLAMVVPCTLPWFHAPAPRARSTALFIGAVCAILHLGSVFLEWPRTWLNRRRLVGLYMGHILLLTIRYAGGDINTVLDRDGIIINAVVALAGTIAAAIFIHERRYHSRPRSVEPEDGQSVRNLVSTTDDNRNNNWSLLLFGAPATGATAFLTLWLSMSSSAAPRLSGYGCTRNAGIFIIISFASGAVVATWSQGCEPIFAVLATGFFGVMGSLLFSAVPGVLGYAGGVMLMAVLPLLWLRAFTTAGRVAQAGDVWICGACAMGCLYFVLLAWCYCAAMAGSAVPIFGLRLQGLAGDAAVLALIVLIHIAFAFPDVALAQRLARLDPSSCRRGGGGAPLGRAGAERLWPALVAASLALALPPAVGARLAGVAPLDDAEQDAASGRVSLSRPFHVASWNVQQGYALDGLINFKCASQRLASLYPVADWVALHESDPVHIHSQNHDIVGWLEERVGLRGFYGERGQVMTLGSAALSRWRWKHARSHILPAVPRELGGPHVNRILNEMVININGTDVHLLGTHLESEGDPGVQLLAIAERVRAIDGPVIVVGDFNLWPNGSSEDLSCGVVSCHWMHDGTCDPLAGGPKCRSLTRDYLKLIRDVGLQSAINPHYEANLTGGSGARFHCVGRSGATSVVDGCQEDYIFYRGVSLVESSIHSANGCSDHNVVSASFILPSMRGTIDTQWSQFLNV